jgi:hypothetical protein
MGTNCWMCHRASMTALRSVIVHLFNYHVVTAKDWTIERLADWVRSIEPPEPNEVAKPTEEAVLVAK